MRIRKEDSALLIIDVQEKLFPHMHEGPAFLQRLQVLIRGFKILELPVLMTQQYSKGLGETITPVKDLMEKITPLEKMSFSCCDESRVMTEILKLNRKYIIIAGIESHVCVLQTAMDLAANGLIPVVVEDCITSRRENDKRIALGRMRDEGSVITTCESLLLELCRVSGSERFKAISALIK